MVGRSDYGFMVKEGQAFCQRGFHLDPPPIQPQTSWNDGQCRLKQLQNIRKLLFMKGRGVSIGIDLSHGDCPIAAPSVSLVNAHLPLQTGAAS